MVVAPQPFIMTKGLVPGCQAELGAESLGHSRYSVF